MAKSSKKPKTFSKKPSKKAKSSKTSKSRGKLSAIKNLFLGTKKKKELPKKAIKVAKKPAQSKLKEKEIETKKLQTKIEIPVKPSKEIKTGLKSKKSKSSTDSETGVFTSGNQPEFDRHGEAICRELGCESLSTSGGYCRLHYIKNWKKIKRKELIIKEGKLNRYIEELVSKYPDKYIEAIRQDLSSDKDFYTVIHDLELDESIDDFDADGESVDSLIDSIRRDLDDDGDVG